MFPSSNDAEFLNYVGCHARYEAAPLYIKVSHHNGKLRSGIMERDRNWNNWSCQSDSREIPGSINLILVKANKFVSIDFPFQHATSEKAKMDLNWPIKLTMSLSFILNWSQTTSFKMTSFFTKCSVCGGQKGQLGFPGTGHSALSWVICTKMC